MLLQRRQTQHALAAKALPEKLKTVRTNKGGSGIEPVRKLGGQGRMGSIFRDLC